tara:strand:+ start:942 stop:1739 length:798 start_codon:yes stop_codon:yes gene_type:complete
MKIFIITMDDPVYTLDFIKNIVIVRKQNIVGVAVPKGDRLKLAKGKSRLAYLISLFLIMGLPFFMTNVLKSMLHKIKKNIHSLGLIDDPTILGFAEKNKIPTYRISSPNNKEFIKELISIKPDIIINQSQNIIKKDLLKIPSIGVLNRHNALLPKNRGRLTPFWVLFNKEKETGVSIHFVEEGLDSGDIIVQKKFKVEKNDNFRSIVKKNYELASIAMIEALNLLENNISGFIENNDDEATYNSTPTLNDAWTYRKRKILEFFCQ